MWNKKENYIGVINVLNIFNEIKKWEYNNL